jgi:hypothetical protein
VAFLPDLWQPEGEQAPQAMARPEQHALDEPLHDRGDDISGEILYNALERQVCSPILLKTRSTARW